ncbi:site-specific DNA-methyltransferase [Denitrificimonas sp. JX-1]|uniref:site-specific DNA-methyltransferase (adenine-specific) n=1 Tax=Denitrificimonas halotolerans TaxID=3098930 RepID=A0ABU5GP45_9GAMM|nr:site-specific DNA-methyltransferase [Denitrificimonas sp. JX-1]MDY7218485.1 site-specific DNA-methyltransferase [Denitrificimonas sp. JX-1]
MTKVIPPMDSTSTDIVADNISKLKELFPEAFTEGKVDFDALKEVLGEYVDGRDERYSFTWNGKSKARMIAQTPSTGTLRPCKEESVDWDSTQNLFIEGDNLEVLKLLQKSYHKKVKMIYIDPPYNTGKDFVYKDNFKDNIKNYKEITGQVDGEGRSLSNNPETSGRYHTDWLNMMYPRLKLARNLLRDDGVIFISIDDNEVTNLKNICDEIFGEENFIGTFVVNAAPNGRDYGHIAKNHEFCVFYSKNISECDTNLIPDATKTFKFEDEVSGFNIHPLYNSNEAFHKGNRPNLYYPFYLYTDRPIKEFEGDFYEIGLDKTFNSIEVYPPLSQKNSVQFVWRWGKQKSIENMNQEIMGYKTSSGEYRIVQKMRTDEKLVRSIISGKEYTSRRGTSEVESLLGGKYFSFPKPLALLKTFVISGMQNDSLMLDMFAGSSSSAEAVMRINAEDKGSRQFIMVQLPEALDGKSEASKVGYKTITDISKERIRRAAAKIQAENPGYDGDLGFKAFKLDSTNIKPWELDFDFTAQDLEDQISNIKTDRKEEDVLYEVLLKYGLDLTLPITEHSIDGHKVFNIGMGALMVCLSDKISLEVAEGIAKLKEELNPEIMRVVFKDAGFADDVVKTNALQILKQAGIEDVRSL